MFHWRNLKKRVQGEFLHFFIERILFNSELYLVNSLCSTDTFEKVWLCLCPKPTPTLAITNNLFNFSNSSRCQCVRIDVHARSGLHSE